MPAVRDPNQFSEVSDTCIPIPPALQPLAIHASKISRKGHQGHAKSAKQDAILSVLSETFAGNNRSQKARKTCPVHLFHLDS